MQGALHLFLPAIRQLASKKRPIILVAPPYVPYLPGWHINTDSTQASPLWVVSPDTTTHLLWACEQILQSNSASTVLIWLNPLKKQQHGESQKKNHYHLRSVHLRKLQLAARRSQSLVVALRDINNQQKSSPAPLRICLEPTNKKHAYKYTSLNNPVAGAVRKPRLLGIIAYRQQLSQPISGLFITLHKTY